MRRVAAMAFTDPTAQTVDERATKAVDADLDAIHPCSVRRLGGGTGRPTLLPLAATVLPVLVRGDGGESNGSTGSGNLSAPPPSTGGGGAATDVDTDNGGGADNGGTALPDTGSGSMQATGSSLLVLGLIVGALLSAMMSGAALQRRGR